MEPINSLEGSLNELIHTKSMEWIFVGGKGGVGKTTTACSLALELSKNRESVLILSTDPAHNLSDAFRQKFSSVPTKVEGVTNLYAMELEANYFETGTNLKLEDDQLGLSKFIPELLSSLPGVDEAMSFAELMKAVQNMKYSVIVFDTAPTGHTLRLLSFPDLLEKAFKKFEEFKNKLPGALGMLNAFSGSDDAGDSFTSQWTRLRAITTSVREIFNDPLRCTFVCVCIPEFLSVYETERLVQELTKHGIDASNVVVNQVLFPLEIENGKTLYLDGVDLVGSDDTEQVKLLKEQMQLISRRLRLYENNFVCRRKMQSKYLRQIRDLYSEDFHVIAIPLQPEEVRGIQGLQQFGVRLMTPKNLPIIADVSE